MNIGGLLDKHITASAVRCERGDASLIKSAYRKYRNLAPLRNIDDSIRGGHGTSDADIDR